MDLSDSPTPPRSAAQRLARACLQPYADAFERVRSTARDYSLSKFRGDLIAGLTVAVLELPQAMAYAIIAQVPPQYGIYTSVIQGLFGALFSSNSNLASGPTNTQALLIAAAASQIADPGDAALYLQLVIGLTLVKGIIQLGFAAARMGNLVRYVSHSVIVGFTAGAGVLIAAGQMHNFLGIEIDRTREVLPGVIGTIQRLIPHLHEVNPLALGLGAAALAIAIGAKMISRMIPGPLLAVLLPGLAIWLFGWTGGELRLVGQLPSGFPTPSLPRLSFDQAQALLSGAFALALLGMIETVSIGKALASNTGARINPNQEFFAQGLANTVGAFFQNIPGSGSFTRSALNYFAGGRTLFAGVFNAVLVGVIFLLFTDQAALIPYTSLAAILFLVAYSLIDWPAIRRIIRSGKSDAVVCLITFLAALTLPLDYAIYVGIFLNIALYLRRASQLQLQEMVPTSAGPFLERPLSARSGERAVVFLQIEGSLFFALADELDDRLTAIANSPVRVVILRLKRTHSIDATVMGVLERFIQQMRSRHKHVLLCGVRPELMQKLESFGLVRLIGQANVFEAGYGVFTSAKQALNRARKLLGESIDSDEVFDEDETENWSYQI